MERLQKVLAQAGIASRRKCEEYITSGRVTVNDVEVKELGVKVNPDSDVIKVDGKPIKAQKKIYLMLNKPKGVITSATDPEGRKVVTDFLPGIKERVYPVGRLDYDTEGLLILTNDGEFANLLTHPRHHVPRTYHATVEGNLHGNVLDKLQAGVKLDDGMTAPAEAEYYDVNPDKNETIVAITIFEGRNRQVRRMFEALEHPLVRLKRVSFGSLELMGLPRGKYRELGPAEVKALREDALAAASAEPDTDAAEPAGGQSSDKPGLEPGLVQAPKTRSSASSGLPAEPKRSSARGSASGRSKSPTKSSSSRQASFEASGKSPKRDTSEATPKKWAKRGETTAAPRKSSGKRDAESGASHSSDRKPSSRSKPSSGRGASSLAKPAFGREASSSATPSSGRKPASFGNKRSPGSRPASGKPSSRRSSGAKK